MGYWIGRVDPSMWWQAAWWQAMLPKDVRLAVLSLGVNRLVDEQLELAHKLILEKVELLDREGMDVINVGGSPVVGVHGRAGHQRLLDDIGRITKRPYVTALLAELEGLRALGATRIAIASPYPIKQTERRVVAMQEEGFEVVGHRSMDIERNRDITEVEPAVVRRFVGEVAAANPTAEAIYVPCGGFPVPLEIATIEQATGRPLVTNVQAQVAATLRRIGHPGPVQGFGRLLEGLGAAVA